jgi:membrane protein YdbS with pleckstrin-like domain
MLDLLKALVLGACKVPPEPVAPAGSPGSIRVFRAAANFYKLSLLKWSLAQAAAVGGTLFWLSFDVTRHISPARVWVGGAFHALELVAFVVLLLQMPFTYFVIRLDYEMRWYIVTDRSLRIRYGVVNVREMTMTFANIQQMTVRQGPLQRLLGLADLQVQTAGGGGSGSGEGGSSHGHGADESMHVGLFRGVDNAEQIRDLIVERLRSVRDAGLGDLEDHSHARPVETSTDPDTLRAAYGLLEEARSLRKSLEQFDPRRDT